MKKIITIIFLLLFVTGCSKKETTSDVVKRYLDNYNNLSKDVKKSLDSITNREEFSSSNKEMYKKIFIRQYKDLKYTILTEEYDDDKALITVNINVYDLNKAEETALDYLSKNLKDFYNEDNKFDNSKYIAYKLKLMCESTDRINYEVVFYLYYKNNKWVLEQPTDSDLEKIHGIYNED